MRPPQVQVEVKTRSEVVGCIDGVFMLISEETSILLIGVGVYPVRLHWEVFIQSVGGKEMPNVHMLARS
jgi:hypothetical protein